MGSTKVGLVSITPVIIAGGLGSRLWPLSSKSRPKPFIEIFGKRSLFQKTLTRLNALPNGTAPLVITNQFFEEICRQQAKGIGVEDLRCLVEPCMKNTAPAIATAAYFLSKQKKDAVMLVLPADHVISPIDEFLTCVDKAVELAEMGYIVTFGIDPTEPKTCYGYIEKGEKLGLGYAISSFKEKPCKEKAKQYIASKKCFWNSGMFLTTVSTLLREMQHYAPEMLAHVKDSVDKGRPFEKSHFLDSSSYQKIQAGSIDHTIMEKTHFGAIIPSKMGWSDIGTWDSYWSHQSKDKDGNVLEGKASAIDSKQCLFVSKEYEMVGFGVENIVAIASDNKIMITTKEKAPELKKIIGIKK